MTEQTQLFKAIQHPTRQEILNFLHDYPAEIPYSDLLPFCDESTGKLNYHLRILEDLITRTDQGYDLSDRGKHVVGWIRQLDQATPKEYTSSRPDVIINRIYPSERLFTKYVVQTLIIFLLILLPTVLGAFFVEFLLFIILLELIILGCTIWFLKTYTRSIWYRLTETEVEVHKGVITLTHKIVPYRTITNVDHKEGPFDRFFNMATVDIHTAGNPNANTGPAEKLVGMIEAHEIRETLLERIRLLNPLDFVAATKDSANRSSAELLAIKSELESLNRELIDGAKTQ